MRRPVILTALLVGLLGSVVHGQEVTPSATSFSIPTPPPDPIAKEFGSTILVLNYNVADSTNLLVPSPYNQARVVQTAEDLIDAYCIRDISPNYRGSFGVQVATQLECMRYFRFVVGKFVLCSNTNSICTFI